ncbi:MAG: DUF134 domain-containing protein [Nanoarchaeota archaeon]
MGRCKRKNKNFLDNNKELLEKILNIDIEEIDLKRKEKGGTIEICKRELIALLLKDALNLNCDEASKLMNLSKPTYWRTLNSARKKLADAILRGNKIIIFNDE